MVFYPRVPAEVIPSRGWSLKAGMFLLFPFTAAAKSKMTPTCNTSFCELEATLELKRRTTHRAERKCTSSEDEEAAGERSERPCYHRGWKMKWWVERSSCMWTPTPHGILLTSRPRWCPLAHGVAVKVSLLYFLFIWSFHHAPLPLWFQRGWPNGYKMLKGHQSGKRSPIC